MNKLSEILTENIHYGETYYLLGDSYSEEVSDVLHEIVSAVAQDLSSAVAQDLSSAVVQVQNISLNNTKLSWQPYIDALQQDISTSLLNSNEMNFIQTICNNSDSLFLRDIKTYISAISIKEYVNMIEITKLIMFIHKKIKEITGLQIKNIRIVIVLEYLINSFLNSNLLIVENKEDIKKHVKEVLELLTINVPAVKTGCMGMGCILC